MMFTPRLLLANPMYRIGSHRV